MTDEGKKDASTTEKKLKSVAKFKFSQRSRNSYVSLQKANMLGKGAGLSTIF